jgi:hypothetical protein
VIALQRAESTKTYYITIIIYLYLEN